jgi:hypothetical protein
MDYKVIHNQSETFTYMGQFHCYPQSIVKLPAHVADHVVASYEFFKELPVENYEHLTPFNSVDFATYVDVEAPVSVVAQVELEEDSQGDVEITDTLESQSEDSQGDVEITDTLESQSEDSEGDAEIVEDATEAGTEDSEGDAEITEDSTEDAPAKRAYNKRGK